MDDEREIRWLGDLTRVQPQPGDVFVLQTEHCLMPAQREHLKAAFRSVFGDAKVLVLEGGVTLGVMGKEQPE